MSSRVVGGLIVVLCFGIGTRATAKCGPGGLDIEPADGSITPSGTLILYGGSDEVDTITSLPTLHVWLDGDRRDVDVRVVAVHVGEAGLAQAVLRPLRALDVGATYLLRIDGVSPARMSSYWRGELHPFLIRVRGSDPVRPLYCPRTVKTLS